MSNPLADLSRVMHDARTKFVEGFPQQCASLAALAQAPPQSAAIDAAVAALHRMAGLGGTIGFARVSERAAELENALRGPAQPLERVGELVDGLRRAFEEDRSLPAAPPHETPKPLGVPLTVMLVEDNLVQRTILSGQLRTLGHRAIAVASGEDALASARTERPDVILLDVELPGMSGHEVCRLLKADPNLASVPVAFLTAHTTLDERLNGLRHGADDFFTKPLDVRELALRLQLLNRHRAASLAPKTADVLDYDGFRAAAADALSRGRAALALIRTPAGKAADVAAFIRDEIRRRDLCGEYDRTQVAVLLPDASATTCRQRLTTLVEKCLANGISGVHAGVTASETAAGRTLDELLEEADEALARARYEKVPAALRPEAPEVNGEGAPAPAPRVAPLVLIADDDPDVVRILDAHLAAGSYRRTIAFDGSRALEEVRAQRPAVVILDLMMPRLTGFDVLAGLRELEGNRPRTIVLSARGREEDVIRAFTFGADDFMTKPFNPQELLARVARLVR
jgi:DNA-binding response OmpR family regulator